MSMKPDIAAPPDLSVRDAATLRMTAGLSMVVEALQDIGVTKEQAIERIGPALAAAWQEKDTGDQVK